MRSTETLQNTYYSRQVYIIILILLLDFYLQWLVEIRQYCKESLHVLHHGNRSEGKEGLYV